MNSDYFIFLDEIKKKSKFYINIFSVLLESLKWRRSLFSNIYLNILLYYNYSRVETIPMANAFN